MRRDRLIATFLCVLFAALPSLAGTAPFIDASDRISAFERGALGLFSEGLGGAAWLDYDADGDLDLYLTNSFLRRNVLFRNDGDAGFTDVARAARVSNGWGNAGALAGDIDNDGCVDLFLTGAGGIVGPWQSPHKLYVNNCDGTFSDYSGRDGIRGPFPGLMAAFGDIDNDGYLDLFVTSPGSFFSGRQTRNTLYRNNGDRSFSEIGSSAGVDTALGGCVAGFTDFDADGFIDIFVGNCNDLQLDPTPLELWRNNGDLTFTDIAPQTGLHELGYWMGLAFADYDVDGDLDLFSTSGGISMPGNPYHGLFRRQGRHLDDVALAAGVGAWEFGWGACFLDLENDGDEDLFFTGSIPPLGIIGPGAGNPGRLFRNDGEGAFVHAESYGLESSFSSGVAAADYDGDGGVDLVVVRSGWIGSPGRALLLRNAASGNRWLTVRLVGTTSNRQGIGARITVGRGGARQIREVSAGASFISTNSPWPTFGLVDRESVDVEVAWPSGRVDRFRDVATDRVITLVEGSGEAAGRGTALFFQLPLRRK